MRSKLALALTGLVLLVSGCGTVQQQPGKPILPGSIAVVYVDPAVPMSVLRYNEGDANVYGGGAFGALASAINNAAGQNNLEGKLAEHAEDLAKMDPIGHNYETVHAVLSTVPWLQQAVWQRVQSSSAESSRDLAQAAGAAVVVVVYPVTMLYGNADPLVIHCQVDIYTAGADTSSRPHRVDDDTLDAVAATSFNGDDELPSRQFHNQYLISGEVLDRRMATIFGNDAAPLRFSYKRASDKLKSALSSYFASHGPPAR